jgi:hypothetical protein
MCSVTDCDRPIYVRARRMCSLHYNRWRKHGDVNYTTTLYECTVEGCSRPHQARGMCSPHYMRWHRYGDPLAGQPTFYGDTLTFLRDAIERAKDGETECIDWPFAKGKYGHGHFVFEGRTQYAHALACAALHGPRPEGLEAAHSCNRGCCVNGNHLRWATRKENEADKRKARSH